MKKYFSLLLIIVMVMSQTICIYAKTGDIYTYTKYTDISAYINNYVIPSYNIEGYTGVAAEDLTYYGFNVAWSEAERTLKISRNTLVNEITQYIQPTQTAPVDLGKNSYAVLNTDIRTFVNDVEIASYNIGGKTVIIFDSLGAFGKIAWDDGARKIKLWVEDGLEIAFYEYGPKSFPKTMLYSSDGRTIEVYEYEVTDYLNVGWYKTKEEANEIKNLSEDIAAIKNFYVGQQVCEWVALGVRYGIIKEVNYSNGKVKVYWNRVVEADGRDMEYLYGRLLGLYTETWERASGVKSLY